MPIKERCSVCRQYKLIIKRLKTGISGTSHRFRQTLVCAECDEANTEQYRRSQIRYIGEQIQMIDKIAGEKPDLAGFFTETRAKYAETLALLESGPLQ